MASQKNAAAIPVIAFPVVEPILVDIKGAARMLSSTTWTVRNLLWAKKIPFVKIGRRFLIDPADIRAFIAREKAAQMAA
jgi:excisionase family DNA binding protein